MAPSATLNAVNADFDGLRRKNLDDVPFAPDIQFESPLSPAMSGAQSVRAFLQGVFPAITGVRVLQTLCEGEYTRGSLRARHTVWRHSGVRLVPRRGRPDHRGTALLRPAADHVGRAGGTLNRQEVGGHGR